MGTVEARGGVFRRGHLVLVAAMPNSGKSRFALKLAAEINRPTVYFSADQDPWQSITVLSACLTGDDKEAVAQAFASGNGSYYEGALSRSHVHFCFDSNPTLEDIGIEIDAWVETWDSYPEVIVIDTLRNVEGEGDKATDLFIMSELHKLARDTRACVIVLAHMTEANAKNPFKPLPRKDLINKVSELPDMALSVAYDSDNLQIWVAVVKTREGKADPLAEHPIPIKADFDRMVWGHAVSSAPSWGNER